MNRRAAALLAATVLAGSLAACSVPLSTPATGIIIEKDHDRGACSTKKKVTKCKPDSYEFDIRTASGDEVEVDVDRYEFDRYRVGDRYPR